MQKLGIGAIILLGTVFLPMIPTSYGTQSVSYKALSCGMVRNLGNSSWIDAFTFICNNACLKPFSLSLGSYDNNHSCSLSIATKATPSPSQIADFSLSPGVTLKQSSSYGNYGSWPTITVTPQNGFIGSVDMSISQPSTSSSSQIVPKCSLSPSTVSVGDTVLLWREQPLFTSKTATTTLFCDSNGQPGSTYIFTVFGTANSIIHSTTVTYSA